MNKPFELGELNVFMEQPTIKVVGDVAWIFGIDQATRRTKDGELNSGPNFGTSALVKRDGRWLMVLHQTALTPR